MEQPSTVPDSCVRPSPSRLGHSQPYLEMLPGIDPGASACREGCDQPRVPLVLPLVLCPGLLNEQLFLSPLAAQGTRTSRRSLTGTLAVSYLNWTRAGGTGGSASCTRTPSQVRDRLGPSCCLASPQSALLLPGPLPRCGIPGGGQHAKCCRGSCVTWALPLTSITIPCAEKRLRAVFSNLGVTVAVKPHFGGRGGLSEPMQKRVGVPSSTGLSRLSCWWNPAQPLLLVLPYSFKGQPRSGHCLTGLL